MDLFFPYFRVNVALNRVFFDGRFSGQPLYLSLDNEMRDELASVLGCNTHEVEDQICNSVRRLLRMGGELYTGIISETLIWLRSGMKESPPFTGILFCLSHAASLMAAEGDFAANNYYRRLSQLTEVPINILQRNRKDTEVFWDALDQFLLKNNYELGRPTARAVNDWRFVGKAISQAIIRASDRSHFHDMFEKFRFSGGETINVIDMEHYLSAWIVTSEATQRLKTIWRNPDLRERIAESAIAELANWNRSTNSIDLKRSLRPFRLLLLVHLVQSFPRHTLELHLGRFDDADSSGPFTLQGSEAKFYLANEVFGGIATLSPPLLSQDERSFSVAVHLEPSYDPTQPALEWEPRLIIPLAMNSHTNLWTEVPRLGYGVPHCVLVRDANSLPALVENYFSETCPQLPAKATSSQLSGLPKGWILYQNVQVRQISDVRKELNCLVPIGDDGALILGGGLQLLPSFYHTQSPPRATFIAPKGPTQIVAADLDGTALVKANSDGAECNLDLTEVTVARREAITIVAKQDNRRSTTKELFFRDADRPHPLNQDGRGRLAYVSTLSASAFAEVSKLTVEGFTATGELPALPSFSEGMSVPIHGGSKEDSQSAVLAKPLARLASSQICIDRGYHVTVFPMVKEHTPSGTPVEGRCSDCNRVEVLIYKRKNSNSRVSSFQGRVQLPGFKPPVTIDVEALDHDLLLDALCFLGQGTWSRFISLFGSYAQSGQQIREIAHTLFLLGHLDVEIFRGTNAVKSWCVPPPSLNFTSETSAFLSGFRSSSFFCNIEEAVRSAGGRFFIEQIGGRPSMAIVEGLDVETAYTKLSNICDPIRRSLLINAAPAEKIIRACAAFQDFKKDIDPVSIGRSRNLQQFNLSGARWEDASAVLGSGAYRLNEGVPIYAYVDMSGQAYSAAYRVVKLLAACERGVRLHHYLQTSCTFISTLGCEPPGLLERALVGCSGHLPSIGTGLVSYTGVSFPIASAILHNLYSERHEADEAS